MVIRLDCHICFCFNSIKFYIPVLGLSMVWDLWSWTQRCALSPPGNPSNPVLSVRTLIAPRCYIRPKWKNPISHHQQTNCWKSPFLFADICFLTKVGGWAWKSGKDVPPGSSASHLQCRECVLRDHGGDSIGDSHIRSGFVLQRTWTVRLQQPKPNDG